MSYCVADGIAIAGDRQAARWCPQGGLPSVRELRAGEAGRKEGALSLSAPATTPAHRDGRGVSGIMRVTSFMLLVVVPLGVGPAGLSAQVPYGDSLTTAGIFRASAVVESVFVSRLVPESTVDGGDFASYLMARLGVMPIPRDLGFRVAIQSQQILLNGRVRDLPTEAREELGMLLSMVPSSTPLVAQIELLAAGSRAVRFRLASVTLGGMQVPETLLRTVMSQIGRRYPSLGESGRDLTMEIPPNAHLALVPGGVRLVGPARIAGGSQ